MEKKQGLIAVLDALGAASYSDHEISVFLDSRQRVLDLLRRKVHAAEVRGTIGEGFVSIFTFNDTVLIVYRTEGSVTLQHVEHFCRLLRKFMVDSLAAGILFRGSVSLGTFYVDDESNTVMGQAVTDAAAWYDSTDWIGINATPHATLAIQAMIERTQSNVAHVLVDYPVPIKDRSTLALKAINWPKALAHPSLTPFADGDDPRAKCLSLLTDHRIPKSTEPKYFNTMRFFDHCIGLWHEDRRTQKRRKRANRALQPTSRAKKRRAARG